MSATAEVNGIDMVFVGGAWVESVQTRENREASLIMHALDTLGIALAGHCHIWTAEQREAYESAHKAISHLASYVRGNCPPETDESA